MPPLDQETAAANLRAINEAQMQRVATRRALGDDGNGSFRAFVVISLIAAIILLIVIVTELDTIINQLNSIYERMGQMHLY